MIDTTCPMCSRCNKVSKTHTNIECPCGCWYSPPQLSPTGDNLDLSSGEYCDVCDHIADVLLSFPKEGEFPCVICKACTVRIVKASSEAAEADQLSVIERLHVQNLACKYLKSIESSPTGDNSKRDVTNADFMRVIEETQSAMMTQNMNLRQSLDRCMAFLQSMSTLESHDIDEYGWHCPKCHACKIAKFLRKEEAIAKW